MISAETNTVTWGAEYRQALADRAAWWMDEGAIVLPVIPTALPADRFPRIVPKTGQPKTDKEGNLVGKFGGKAPSSWDRKTGEPYLYQREAIIKGTRRPPTREQVLRDLLEPITVGPAAEFGYPIGFCVLCTESLVVVDLDVSERNEELISRASGEGHYIETTPSGGLHLVVACGDLMESWANPTKSNPSGHFTKWALEQGGEECGEVLSTGKVCLMAPTMRGDGGIYKVFPRSGEANRDRHGNQLPAEIDDLTSALGIYPTASKANRKKPTTAPAKHTSGVVKHTPSPKSEAETPELRNLVGKLAGEMLCGNLSAYGDPLEDRSAILASFANEVYGTENWLLASGKPFLGTADELINEVIDSLSSFDEHFDEPISDKADRILDTIARESCDISDEEKRDRRYNYQARDLSHQHRINPCDAKAQAEAGGQDRPPFVLRGFTTDQMIFGVEETGLDHSVRINAFNQANLLPLAPMRWWAEHYPRLNKEGETVGIDWHWAADDLLRTRESSSVYDPSGLRGLGVWVDEDRTVVHCGGELLVDGERIPFAHHQSRHIYVKSPAAKGPAATEPTSDELRALISLVERWHFADNSGAPFVLGWVVTSLLSGALNWRPNLWLTGPTVAGKSSLIDEVLRKLIAPVGGRGFAGETTAAGIRQSLGHSAVPVIIDELESDNDNDRRRVDQIVAMVRSSSSNQGAEVAKGTTNGSAVTYLLRSSFLFASVNAGLTHAQDKNRTVLVRLKPLTPEQRAKENETIQLWDALTTQMGSKLLTRCIRLLPVIEANAKVIEQAMTASGTKPTDPRLAKVQGLLIAGFASLSEQGAEVMTIEVATKLVGKVLADLNQDLEAEGGDQTNSDAIDCLRHLLLHRIKIHKEVGSNAYPRREAVEITVQEALNNFVRPGSIDLEEIKAELLRQGLKVGEYQGTICLMVANGHKGVSRIYEHTPWRNYSETLKRPGADGIATGVQSFGGKIHKHRCTRFAVETLVDANELPPTKKPKLHWGNHAGINPDEVAA